jgi:hypothetical protein
MDQVVVLFSAEWSDAAQELRELLVSNTVRGHCWIAGLDVESPVYPVPQYELRFLKFGKFSSVIKH